MPPTALVVLSVLLLVAFAPAAHLTAKRLPVVPGDPTPVVSGTQRDDSTALRPLPAGLPADEIVDSVDKVYPYAVEALGVPGAHTLVGLLSSDNTLDPDPLPGSASGIEFTYPYHYSAFDPIFDGAPQPQSSSNATQLAAALVKLASQPRRFAEKSNAARAAYALLEHTRSTGGCDAALDVLLLVASDYVTSPDNLAKEYRRAAAACPNDPTPGWIMGQSQLRSLFPSYDPRPTQFDESTLADLATALTRFEGLAKQFPDDGAAHTGLGDAYLRRGLRILSSEPFTARNDLRLAIAQYNRAAELGSIRDADLGRARAFIGLGEPDRAIQLAQRAADGSPHPGAAMEVLLLAQQAAHDFDAAAYVGRRLERSGPAAYPPAAIFLPVPRTDGSGLPFEAGLPLSTGADTLAPLAVSLAPTGGAGGQVDDLSFIPQYRDDFSVTSTMVDTPSMAWRRNAIVAGRAGQLLAAWPTQFPTTRPDRGPVEFGATGFPNDTLRAIAELAAHEPVSGKYVTTDLYLEESARDGAFDSWQNLLRWAGDLPQAQLVIERWQSETGDSSAAAAMRLGEVGFLRGNYDESAVHFGEAARQARLLRWSDDLPVNQAQLGRGAALLKADRADEAVPLLRELEQDGPKEYGFEIARKEMQKAAAFAAVAYHASVQLADHESATGSVHSAIEDYNIALWWVARLSDDFNSGNGMRPEVVHNNLALAYLAAGAIDSARANADRALESDPMNPVFLMTAGFVAERAGNSDSAIDYNRRALESDPGAFAAANDLGVELARRGDYTGAQDALRQAVGAAPGYALGWFNLGVVESQRGPLRLLTSQGAFAKAFTLDPTLKDRKHELMIDGSVYRTALDLSKPLPPQWSLAQTQKSAPVASVGLLAIAMLGVGLARASGGRGGAFAKQWLEPVTKRLDKIRGPSWIQRAAVGVIVTVTAFLLTYLRHAGSVTEIVAYCVGVVLLGGLAYFAREAIAARQAVGVAQSSWTPGLALGLVTGALGTPWAPLPVARTDTESRHVHLAAPLALAALSLALFVEVAWLDVPLTGAFAVAALIMTSSTLLPIKPLDGANLGSTGAVAAAGVMAGAIFVALGVA